MTLATEGLAPDPTPASAPAGGTAAPVPADAGGGAPVTPAAGAAATAPAPAPTPTPGAAPAATPDAGDVNWRAQMAGGDAELAKRLERFASPKDFMQSFVEKERKISSGELKRSAPGPDASPEDLKAWRAESGIPEAPEGYFEKIELPTGVTLGEADKPFANSFAEYAHKEHMTPKQVSAAMAWYYDTVDKQSLQSESADAEFKVQARDALNQEWRGDFKANMNAMQSVVATAPDEVKTRLFGGRTADGKIIGDDPAVMKWLAGLGRELNPAATLLPPGVPQNSASVDAEIKQIEGRMGTPDYWKDTATQDRYRELVNAREKMQSR